MKNYLILLFSLFLFIFVPKIQAQSGPATGMRFVCLDAQWCKAAACPSGQTHVHRTALSTTTQKAVANSKTYVTECVALSGFADSFGLEDIICTTGNSDLDIELFCGDTTALEPDQINQCDHYKRMKSPDIDYKLDIDDSPGIDSSYGIYHHDTLTNQYVKKDIGVMDTLTVQSDSLGNIPKIEWQSYTKESRMRKFLIWNKIIGTDNVPREGEGQKQADLPFVYGSSLCNGNAYDPYGKTFDMMTLEPIPNSQVFLKQLDVMTGAEVRINAANPHIVNPFFTGSTGHFSFVVVDGNYALSPVSAAGYEHAVSTDPTLLLPVNANRIYSDFYYADSPAIRQRGAIEHRDVVMKPNNNTGNVFPLEILDETPMENNGTLLYSGFLSHPFVLLDVDICTPGTPPTCNFFKQFDHRNGGPNKDGKFLISLNQATLQNGQYYKMKFTKQDLAKANLSLVPQSVHQFISWIKNTFSRIVSSVYAQDSGSVVESQVEPIPAYLEGYAYDNEGNLMPNATVGIYVSFSEAPLYRMNADNNGFFRITSEYIPATEYSLRFTSKVNPQNISYQSTSQFLANNNTFIEAEKIKIYKFISSSTNPRRNVTPSYIPEQKISPLVTEVSQIPEATPSSTKETQTTTTPTSRNPIYLVGAVLLILLGGAGVMLAIYVYKKRSIEDKSSPTE